MIIKWGKFLGEREEKNCEKKEENSVTVYVTYDRVPTKKKSVKNILGQDVQYYIRATFFTS